MSSISRLPPEIITNIIVSFAHDGTLIRSSGYLPDISLSVSHVCQLWRNVALGSVGRALWAYVPLTYNLDGVRAFLLRSDPLPLLLRIEAGDAAYHRSRQDALSEVLALPRTRARISVMLLDYDNNLEKGVIRDATYRNRSDLLLLDIMDKLGGCSFPNLEHLSRSSDKFSRHDWFSEAFLMFSKRPQRLRILSSVDCDIMINPRTLRRTLTSLHMSNLTLAFSDIDLDGWLDALSNMTVLQQFIFRSKYMFGHFNQISRLSSRFLCRSVELPNLQLLCLEDAESSNMLALFHCLCIPVTARIHLQCTQFYPYKIEEFFTLEHMSIAFRDHYAQNGGSASFNELTISSAQEGDIAVTAIDGSLSIGRFSFAISSALCGHELYDAMLFITSLPAIQSATDLRISANDYFSAPHGPSLWSALENMHNIRRVYAARSVPWGLFAPTTPNDIFPELQCITVYGADLYAPLCDTNGLILAQPLYVSLLDHAVQRDELKTIILGQCSIPLPGAQALKRALLLAGVELIWEDLRTDEPRGSVVSLEKGADLWDKVDRDIDEHVDAMRYPY